MNNQNKNIPSRRIVQHAFLRAESKRNAFYMLFLEEDQGRYYVRKISGGADAINDERQWEAGDITAAQKLYDQIVSDKTRTDRKSPRKYHVEYATTR